VHDSITVERGGQGHDVGHDSRRRRQQERIETDEGRRRFLIGTGEGQRDVDRRDRSRGGEGQDERPGRTRRNVGGSIVRPRYLIGGRIGGLKAEGRRRASVQAQRAARRRRRARIDDGGEGGRRDSDPDGTAARQNGGNQDGVRRRGVEKDRDRRRTRIED